MIILIQMKIFFTYNININIFYIKNYNSTLICTINFTLIAQIKQYQAKCRGIDFCAINNILCVKFKG